MHVEANTKCLEEGRTWAHLLLFSAYFRGHKKHHLKALKQNGSTLHQWEMEIPRCDPTNIGKGQTEKQEQI